MSKAEEFFAQWLRMREEFMNSDAYKEERRLRQELHNSLQEYVDEHYPGKKIARWCRVTDKDGNPVFMFTFKK